LCLVRLCTGKKCFFGKLESWKIGKLENWKVGKLESWKIGKKKSWKIEEIEKTIFLSVDWDNYNTDY